MRALVYDAVGTAPRVTALPDPVAPPGGAVVRVAAAGLCRSDWHAWAGHDADVATFPHVPGHEFAGVVESVGEGVDPSWVDRPVTAPFVHACGRCPTCAAGDGQVCPHQRQPGFTDPGAFAERVVVLAADTNLVALPGEVDPATAAGLGCRVATAHRAVTARARVVPGQRVVVLGCGGVGLAAVQLAVARGAEVCAVDVDAGSRERASAVGADLTLDGAAGDDVVVDAVRDWSDGGAHVAIEAVGSPDACRVGVLALRRRGRHVQVGLLPPAAGAVAVPMDRVVAWELDVLGSHGMAAADYPAMLDLVARGRLRPDRLVRRTVGLAEAADLVASFDRATAAGITLVDPAQ